MAMLLATAARIGLPQLAITAVDVGGRHLFQRHVVQRGSVPQWLHVAGTLCHQSCIVTAIGFVLRAVNKKLSYR